ncbi:RNA 2',3'-cyclic phosphodiesterase [Motiliproteus sp. MSK22-1]|uniref:RNA 2',3'-cyclic phosphodiesterase n=1 Tax=Motiliproteus sp. MSK22-1 TaxID=1897630 RepID=UPI0009764EA4|nr:RNA 2',3'-cyclic phosphodiesterase [Motiliproteus sp. MSK22-1]OMH25867.1 2'-5' RNA ligase [Motiliproteus sp. MSK22-1]
MRLFTSIDLPEPMKQKIDEICWGLPRIRWLPSEQRHITLVFIGEVNPSQLSPIAKQLKMVQFPEFELNCHGIGSFRSGVLWLGVQLDQNLRNLEQAIRYQLSELKALKLGSRKFHPHITLGRMDHQNPPKLNNFLALNNNHRFTFSVTEFQLLSSQLSPKGARHYAEQTFTCL